MAARRSSPYEMDPKKRAAKFKRRSASLIKLTSELSTLCNIPACIVITCPETGISQTWPEDPESFHRVFDLYKSEVRSGEVNKRHCPSPVLDDRVKKMKGTVVGADGTDHQPMNNRPEGIQAGINEIIGKKDIEVGSASMVALMNNYEQFEADDYSIDLSFLDDIKNSDDDDTKQDNDNNNNVDQEAPTEEAGEMKLKSNINDRSMSFNSGLDEEEYNYEEEEVKKNAANAANAADAGLFDEGTREDYYGKIFDEENVWCNQNISTWESALINVL